MNLFRFSPLVALFGLTACFSSEPIARTSGAIVQQRLAGSSVIGSLADGVSYCEFHDPGGLVVGRDTEVYAGNWRIAGDSICYTYPGAPQDCQLVQINGNSARFVTPFGGLISQGNIVAGNVCS